MKIGRWSIALLGLLGVMTFLVACSQPTLTAATMAEMSWWDHVKRSLVQNNFLGYVIPLLIAVAGLVFRLRMLRFAILVFAIVYLGFVLGLRFSGLGAPSTFIMFLNETGIKVNMSFYLTWAFLIVLGLFVGRLFCGWVCPMGAFQQLLFRKDMAG
ncbi:MAG: 4Fe-4S binding protein [Dehalococcoidia bacterium]|nr:4Fe-4S binding protein [Dehalococcoidia bacterium]